MNPEEQVHRRLSHIVFLSVLAIAVLCVWLLPGCNSGPPKPPQYQVIDDVLKALEKNDWSKFEEAATTRADVTIQRLGLSARKAKQGYVGSIMRPEEWQHLKVTFEQAVEWYQAGLIIQRSDLENVSLLQRGTEPLILGGEIAVELYELIRKPEKSDRATLQVPVTFLLVSLDRGPKLLDMHFGGNSARDVTLNSY